MTRSKDLLYTDNEDESINLVSGTHEQIQTLIRPRGWRPLGVYSTSSGDFLVIMDSDDKKQTKVLRYSGTTETQIIQWDGQGKPLFIFGFAKDLSENRNSDICVADKGARAVTVVTAAGRFRFRYFGPSSTSRESFEPTCITTDSQANILISDKKNIQIIDQDGYFLRYIDNSGLLYPQSLCVDSRDNLFVAYFNTSEVKKIQYYK